MPFFKECKNFKIKKLLQIYIKTDTKKVSLPTKLDQQP